MTSLVSHDIMRVLLKEVSMNFDYIRMLTYVEVKSFITKMLSKQFKTNFVVKLNNISTDSCSQQVEFEVIASNGEHVIGKATCTNFECRITLNQGKKKTDVTYTNEWAKWVYTTIKQKEFVSDSENKCIISHNFKQDYNEHCKRVRDAKLAEAEKECEANLLK